MSLAQILAIPETERGFDEWSWAHMNHHRAIISAAAQSKNVILQLYNIWPVNLADFQNWLLQHQNMHNDMNGLYRVNGADLTVLDPKNRKELEAWQSLHFSEHRNVAQVCGLPI